MAAVSRQNCFRSPKSDSLQQVEELLETPMAEMFCPEILVLFPDFLASLILTLKLWLWAPVSF